MSVHETKDSTSDSATEIGKKYIKSTIDFAKLKSFQVTASSITLIAKLVLIGGLITIGFVFLSVALAICLGNLYNSIIIGLCITGVIYYIMGLIVFLIRKSIDKNIIMQLSKKFFGEF